MAHPIVRYWLVILGMGLVTYALRLSAIPLYGRGDVPPAELISRSPTSTS